MKSTGIVRKVDNLGRIVLAKELRNVLHIDAGTPLELYVDGDKIILMKYERGCIFCGETNGVVEYKGKDICISCIKELKE